MSTALHDIKQIFYKISLPLCDEWLEMCVEWSKANGALPPHPTIADLRSVVFNHWLDLDLREVKLRSLPPDLGSTKKRILQGTFYLQVMQVVDISKPKLWQLQKIRKEGSKVQEFETEFGKRVLLLTLTDGVQEVLGMEFKPISCLNINIPPGSKLKITGPITLRNGRLMLEPQHVENLEGSCEDLIVTNAAENVLARTLGKEETPNPRMIDEKILEVPEKKTPHKSQKVVEPKRPNPKPVPKTVIRTPKQNFDEPHRISPRSPDLFDQDMDDDLLNAHLDQLESQIQPPVDINDTFATLDIDSYLDEVEQPLPKKLKQSKLSFQKPPPITPKIFTIDSLKDLIPNVTAGKFRIKAKYKNVTEKVKVTLEKIHLAITVCDDTGDLVVEVHTKVAERLGETTLEELEALRQRTLSQDPTAKTKILEVLQKMQNRLRNLNDIFEIEIQRQSKYPILAQIL